MNIFVLDHNMGQCVAYMADKHIVKMVTETAQILSSAYYYTGEAEIAPYKLSHANHPCCVWARSSVENWQWLHGLGLAMYDEYRYRYGDRVHKAGETIKRMTRPNLPKAAFTMPPACVPDAYRREDVVESYRAYYMGEKQHIFRWTRRGIPAWIVDYKTDGEHAYKRDIRRTV